MTLIKEAIRRVLYFFCWLGVAEAEIVVTHGTVRAKFYNWLYEGESYPLFDTQLPD